MDITLEKIQTKGLRCVDLDIEFKKGMNFLQIPNGNGKTTLKHLIQHTLSNDWHTLSEKDIKGFRGADASSSVGSFVIRLGMIHAGKSSFNEFTVEFDFDKGEVDVETFKEMGPVDKYSPDIQIAPFMTSNHVKIFNFSAQDTDNYFDPNSTFVDPAIGTFSGKNHLKDLMQELETKFHGKFSGKKAKKTDTLLRQLKKLEKKETILNGQKRQFERKLRDIQPRWEVLDKKKDNVDIPGFFEKRKEIEQDQTKAKTTINSLDQEIFDLMRYPSNVTKEFGKQLKELAKNLEKGKLPGINSDWFMEISQEAECICGTPMTKEMKVHIQSNKDKYLGSEEVNFFNNIKNCVNTTTGKDRTKDLKEKLKQYEDAKSDLERAEADLKQIDDQQAADVMTPDEIKEYDGLGDQIQQLKNSIDNIVNSKRSGAEIRSLLGKVSDTAIEQIDNLQEIEQAKDKLRTLKAHAEGYETEKKIFDAFKDSIDKALIEGESVLKNDLKDEMNKIINKVHKDKTFGVEKITKAIHLKHGRNDASGAQKVITQTSFALSLLDRTNISFPIIMDHPVLAVQSEDREELCNFLVDISKQCICLVISSEKDGFTRDHLSRKVHPKLEGQNFITAGRKTQLMKDLKLKGYDFTETFNGVCCYERDYFEEASVTVEESDV